MCYPCFGSVERVKTWMEHRGLEGFEEHVRREREAEANSYGDFS
jgi:hypothetical protein